MTIVAKSFSELYSELFPKDKAPKAFQSPPAPVPFNNIKLRWVRPEDLYVAEDYQRYADSKRIITMANNFKDYAMKVVNAVRVNIGTDSMLIVADTQHSGLAMMKAGYSYLPVIETAGSMTTVAEAFDLINTKRKNVAPGTKATMKAHIDPASIDAKMKTIVEGFGYSLQGPPRSKNPYIFSQTRLITDALKGKKYPLDSTNLTEFARAFKIMHSVFGGQEKLRTNGVLGLMLVFAKWNNIPLQDSDLIDFFKSVSTKITSTKRKVKTTYSQTLLFKNLQVATSSNTRDVDFVSNFADQWNAWNQRPKGCGIPVVDINAIRKSEKVF